MLDNKTTLLMTKPVTTYKLRAQMEKHASCTFSSTKNNSSHSETCET